MGSLPVFLGTKGWGYLLDDDVVPDTALAVAARAPEGWVTGLIAKDFEANAALQAADIYNETDYLARESHSSRGASKNWEISSASCAYGGPIRSVRIRSSCTAVARGTPI